MPYWLESDTYHDDPAWDVLAAGLKGGRGALVDALQAANARLKSYASHHKSDGYLTEQAALAQCRGRRQLLDRLCTPVLNRPALLHRAGDDCSCLGDTWIEGFTYRIHAFLKKNPSRVEYERNKDQKADLNSAALKALVYKRDGGCCRYCRSGPLSNKSGKAKDKRKILHHDHIDPDEAAGPNGENFAVSCGSCNQYKGNKTPDEADMVLLPVPTPEEAAALLARPRELHDRPPYVPGPPAGSPADQSPITDGSASDHRSDQNPVADPITDPRGDPTGEPIDDHRAPVRPDQVTDHVDQHTDQGTEVSGLGRVGQPGAEPAIGRGGQPVRSAGDPDIYHRRPRPPEPKPRAPGHHTDLPPPQFVWPAGSVPASPRTSREEDP